ncbi:MAG: PorP/SprF family type IX secretion system membrane protein [Bacteroidota bacterium]
MAVTKYLIACISFIFCVEAFGQDPISSQNTSNPLYLNPGYAGSLGCSRLGLNFRDNFSTQFGSNSNTNVSYDQYVKFLHGGIGLQYMSNKIGKDTLSISAISLIYALNININKNLHIRPALNIAYSQIVMGKNYNEDQSLANQIPPSSQGIFTSKFGFGLLGLYKNFSSGIYIDNITGETIGFISYKRIPYRYMAHTNYKFSFNDKLDLLTGMVYQEQGRTKIYNPSVIAKYKEHFKFGIATRIEKYNLII